MPEHTTPILDGDAHAAVRHRGTHMQIIASAGSGKTEVVSQRVADLLADGRAGRAIVAFTFTERAAAELKDRIARRVEDRLGRAGARPARRAVRRHDPRVLLPAAAAARPSVRDLRRPRRQPAHRVPRPGGEPARASGSSTRRRDRLFAVDRSVPARASTWSRTSCSTRRPCPSPFRLGAASTTRDARALPAAHVRPADRARRRASWNGRRSLRAVHAELRHLIVDEYQDVNPAQERLIELLTGPTGRAVRRRRRRPGDLPVARLRRRQHRELRGSLSRRRDVRRSRPTGAAGRRSSRPPTRSRRSIPGRLDKTMESIGRAGGTVPRSWSGTPTTELDEAGWIAQLDPRSRTTRALRYRDIAVLVRSRAAYPRLVEQFATFDIPVQPGGRTGLFEQPEARVLGTAVAWLTEIDWREPASARGGRSPTTDLLDEYQRVFELDAQRPEPASPVPSAVEGGRSERRPHGRPRRRALRAPRRARRPRAGTSPTRCRSTGSARSPASPPCSPTTSRCGGAPDPTPTRSANRSAARTAASWYYRNLGLHIVNYAQGAYEGFDGEADFALDAVDLTTVHRAKGLEWPVVFVPVADGEPVPDHRTGQAQAVARPARHVRRCPIRGQRR